MRWKKTGFKREVVSQHTFVKLDLRIDNKVKYFNRGPVLLIAIFKTFLAGSPGCTQGAFLLMTDWFERITTMISPQEELLPAMQHTQRNLLAPASPSTLFSAYRRYGYSSSPGEPASTDLP